MHAYIHSLHRLSIVVVHKSMIIKVKGGKQQIVIGQNSRVGIWFLIISNLAPSSVDECDMLEIKDSYKANNNDENCGLLKSPKVPNVAGELYNILTLVFWVWYAGCSSKYTFILKCNYYSENPEVKVWQQEACILRLRMCESCLLALFACVTRYDRWSSKRQVYFWFACIVQIYEILQVRMFQRFVCVCLPSGLSQLVRSRWRMLKLAHH